MTNEHWNILLSIILKDLMGNRITQSNLERIGFVFPELDRIYGHAFTVFMNEHRVAYTNDGLVRFQRDFEFLTWSIHKVAGIEKDEIYFRLANLMMFKQTRPIIKLQPTPVVEFDEEFA
ncbi:MAG: hypothetical protein JWR12_3087 [Mucilaginibacter sp.]|nr:hypothetical protein [Mucilaginibacter sp.]